MRALVFFSLVLLAGPALAVDTGPASQDFKRWHAACRPDGYCLASTGAQAGGADGAEWRYALNIGRPARQTYWEISIRLTRAEADLTRDVVASVGRDRVTFSGPDQIAPYGNIDRFYLLGSGAQALLDKLVHGASLDIGFTDRSGAPVSTSFSLAGLSGALIWIDTRQHRLGSERVAEPPPYGLVRADLPGGLWMAPAIAAQP